MAFDATLTVEGKTFRVLTFNYHASRDYDKYGRPTSELYGCVMEFTVEHTPNCVMLHQWANTNYGVKSGNIVFLRRDNYEQKLTEMRFEEAHVVRISVSFNADGTMPMIEHFTICAKKYEYESQGIFTSMNLKVF